MLSQTTKRWVLLAELLIEKTSSKELDWEETSKSNNYQVVIGNNTVNVGLMKDRDPIVAVFDSDGNSVDVFLGSQLDNLTVGEKKTGDYEKNLRRLINQIQRDVRNADQILDEIIDELQRK